MQADDPNFWVNTENYVDVAIHNRLSATDYSGLTVTYQLVEIPAASTGSETEIESITGNCLYVGTEVVDGITKYIYRCTFTYAMTPGREYAVDFACASISFGKRLRKKAAHY